MDPNWLKNLVGFNLSDEDLQDIRHVKLELYVHVTLKSTEMGALLGSCLGPALLMARQVSAAQPMTERSNAQLERSFVRGGATGALVGLVAGPLITWAVTRNYSKEQFYDTDYRVRMNRPGMLSDRCTAIGALVGGGVAGPTGLVAGLDIGFLCGNIFNLGVKMVNMIGKEDRKNEKDLEKANETGKKSWFFR